MTILVGDSCLDLLLTLDDFLDLVGDEPFELSALALVGVGIRLMMGEAGVGVVLPLTIPGIGTPNMDRLDLSDGAGLFSLLLLPPKGLGDRLLLMLRATEITFLTTPSLAAGGVFCTGFSSEGGSRGFSLACLLVLAFFFFAGLDCSASICDCDPVVV